MLELFVDASSLIYLGKAGAFERIGFVDRLIATEAVWQEAVVAGMQFGAPDASEISSAARRGLVERRSLSRKELERAKQMRGEFGLDRGESEVLAVIDQGDIAVFDDRAAWRAAAAKGVRFISTLHLPVLGARMGEMGKADALTLLHDLALAANPSVRLLLRLRTEIEELR
ncbi:MAG: hypothetical protein WEB00_13245 [Dehalococcoidia bacterium]